MLRFEKELVKGPYLPDRRPGLSLEQVVVLLFEVLPDGVLPLGPSQCTRSFFTAVWSFPEARLNVVVRMLFSQTMNWGFPGTILLGPVTTLGPRLFRPPA